MHEWSPASEVLSGRTAITSRRSPDCLVSAGKMTLLFGVHDIEQQRRGARGLPCGKLVRVDVRDRKFAHVVVIACRRPPDVDVVVGADVGAEAERPPDGMFSARISWARSSSPRFPSSLMERSKESPPPRHGGTTRLPRHDERRDERRRQQNPEFRRRLGASLVHRARHFGGSP